MTYITSKRTLLALAVSATACGPLSAAEIESKPQLEEVTVVAQKREQSLQDVPIAVSAISSSQMQAAGVQDMQDVARLVPTLEVQGSTTPASTSFRIRRVGNLGNIPTFEPAVGVFIDGAFRSRAMFGAGDLFDVERIEVLNGPQSTLYGKNTTAGVVGIYTARPSDQFEWRGELNTGVYDGADQTALYRFKGGVTGPLTGSMRGSLGLSYSGHGDLQEQDLASGGQDANDLGRYTARGQLELDATDALTLRLIVGGVNEDDKTTTGEVRYDPDGYLPVLLGALQSADISVPCGDNQAHNRVGCSLYAARNDTRSQEATLIGELALDNGWTVTSITSWDHFKMDWKLDDLAQVSAPILRFNDTQEAESWQQELRLASAGGETLDWMVGGFWYQQDFQRGDHGHRPTFLSDTLSADPQLAAANQQVLGTPIPLPMAAPGQNGYLNAYQDTDYLGVFGQATWAVNERLSVTGGLRWQQEKKDAGLKQWTNDSALSVISIALSPAAVGGDFDRDTDEVTWSLSPQWFITDSTMAYATVAHGFKSGGYNVGFGRIPADQREFADEKIMNYELGVKTELLDGRMRLGGSVFLTDYKDYQDAAFVGGQFSVGNADKARLQGAEVSGELLLGLGFTADFAVSYADFEYRKYDSGMCYPGRAPDSPTVPGACQLDGEHPVNAPEWTTHLGLQYAYPVGWGELFARGDWSWSDDYNTSFSADPRLVQDAYNWVSLRGGARWGNLELVAWVDNVLDEDVVNYDAVLNIYVGDNSIQSFMQAPRSYGLSLRVNY